MAASLCGGSAKEKISLTSCSWLLIIADVNPRRLIGNKHTFVFMLSNK